MAVAEPERALRRRRAGTPPPPAAMGNSQASSASASSSRFFMASRYRLPTNSCLPHLLRCRDSQALSGALTADTLPRRAFPKQELDGLRELFASLAAQSRTGGRAISRPVFLVGTARTFALLNWSWIWIAISNGFASICAGILPGPGAIRRQAVPAGGEGEWRERWGHVRGFDHLQS